MKRKLKRELGLLDVFCIASGAMISSGLFILPSLAFYRTGPAVVFSYVVAGILILPGMFTIAELTTAMPKAGGVYFFIERSMGAPVGTIGGLANWFSLSLKSAFALLGIGIFATLINPGIDPFQIKLIAVFCCIFFMTINILGVKHTGRLQIFLVLFLLAILLFFVVRGFMFIQPQNYIPFMPYGPASIFATAGLVFISFGGLTKISAIAEEVKNPGRTILLGMFLAFSCVMSLYAGVVFVTVGLLEPSQLSSSLVPISDAASSFAGKPGSIVLAVAALLAFISTGNAGILTASRSSLAMSRDLLLPKFFQKIDPRFKTPYVSIIITTTFMVSVILFLSLENLVKTASTLMILLFSFANIALIIMRESKIQGYRPKFHSPLYPWIQIGGIVGYGVLLFKMGFKPLLISALFIMGSLVWYFVYGRRRVSRRAALLHVIERVTARELVDATLPDELREIIIERDEIIEDIFDHLIKECYVLEIEGSMARDEFFKLVSRALSGRLNVDPDTLTKLFIKREEESHTVIRPGLAIPHIVIEGERKFDVLLARAKQGVMFPDARQPVHTIFVLVGSRDERNLHLRTLAAIAQIAQDKNFDKTWLQARNTQALRDVMLLAERKRFGTA